MPTGNAPGSSPGIRSRTGWSDHVSTTSRSMSLPGASDGSSQSGYNQADAEYTSRGTRSSTRMMLRQPSTTAVSMAVDRHRVSLIIPCRNEAGRIEALLDAIGCQHAPIDEVIIIDTGSTDATPEIVARHRRRHPGLRLQWVSVPGVGIAEAMNLAIRAARGGDCVGRGSPDWCGQRRVSHGEDDRRRPYGGRHGAVRMLSEDDLGGARWLRRAAAHERRLRVQLSGAVGRVGGRAGCRHPVHVLRAQHARGAGEPVLSIRVVEGPDAEAPPRSLRWRQALPGAPVPCSCVWRSPASSGPPGHFCWAVLRWRMARSCRSPPSRWPAGTVGGIWPGRSWRPSPLCTGRGARGSRRISQRSGAGRDGPGGARRRRSVGSGDSVVSDSCRRLPEFWCSRWSRRLGSRRWSIGRGSTEHRRRFAVLPMPSRTQASSIAPAASRRTTCLAGRGMLQKHQACVSGSTATGGWGASVAMSLGRYGRTPGEPVSGEHRRPADE